MFTLSRITRVTPNESDFIKYDKCFAYDWLVVTVIFGGQFDQERSDWLIKVPTLLGENGGSTAKPLFHVRV